ncbi:MAG: phosphatase PAP2 family protein [Rhizobiaceae bacterium]
MNDKVPAPARSKGTGRQAARAGAPRTASGATTSAFDAISANGSRQRHGWLRGIGRWFSFTGQRRNDTRFTVFPRPVVMAELLALFASIIVFLVLFVDPIVLERMRQNGFSGSAFFEMITRLGEAAWILYPTGLVLVGATLFTANRFRGKRRFMWHRLVLNAYFLFTAVAFSGLLANLLKNLIGRARPEFTELGHVWQSMPFGHTYQFAAFPSGHSTTAGAAAIALALLFPRARIFMVLAGIWIAISRPALGVHFPSDMVAGFTFGAAFSWFYARAFARKRLLFNFMPGGGLKLRGAPGFTRFWSSKG